MQHIFKRLTAMTLVGALALGLPAPGESQALPLAADEPQEIMEEVVIVGAQSLVSLQHELYMAEENLYDLFNELNTDDDLDVRCYREARVGTRIKDRVCTTKGHREALRRASQRMFQGEEYVYPAAELKHLQQRMLEDMTKKALENPEMLEALVRATEAKNALETERETRCEGQVLFCW